MTSLESRSNFATRWADVRQPPRGVPAKVRAAVRNRMLSLLGSLTKPSQQNFVRCLYCHYVFDDQADAFEDILLLLQSFGTFITTDQLMTHLDGTKPLEGRYFHLSFDDGFRNNYLNAFPTLRRLDIPAIFFVPSAVIGAPFDVVRDYSLTRVNQKVPIETMAWEDLKTMADAGYEIGSHTRTHARFSDISADAAKLHDEIAGSKEELERGLGRPCKYISWPYGTGRDADDQSLAATRQAGYDACFSAIRGTVTRGRTDRYQIPRHHFEPHWPTSHVRYFACGMGEATA